MKLTKRGEDAAAVAVLAGFILTMGIVGGWERGTLWPFINTASATTMVTPQASPAQPAVHSDAAVEIKPTTIDKRKGYAQRATRNRDMGRTMAQLAGWSDKQWKCLDDLWNRESHWDHLAVNKSSGAAGIPQNITGGDAHFRANAYVQIAWGIKYIKSRYSNDPCAALAFHKKNGYY